MARRTGAACLNDRAGRASRRNGVAKQNRAGLVKWSYQFPRRLRWTCATLRIAIAPIRGARKLRRLTWLDDSKARSRSITAAGQGIGHATALAMAREGAQVFATDVNAEARCEAFAGVARHHRAHARRARRCGGRRRPSASCRRCRSCSIARATCTTARSSTARPRTGTSASTSTCARCT